jgi:uncharacterized protein (DUF1778 family)
MQNALQRVMTEKNQTIQIRLTAAEKAGFTEAADLAGIPLSSWVRERLRLTAIRELENAGRQIPFVNYSSWSSENGK